MFARLVAVGVTTALALLSLTVATGPHANAQSTVAVGFPPIDDLLPSGPGDHSYLFSPAGYVEHVYTGESPGLPEDGWYQDSAFLYLGDSNPETYEWQYPEVVTVTLRSFDSTDRFEVWADVQDEYDKPTDEMVSFGEIGVDEPTEVSFAGDSVRGLRIRPLQHGQLTSLIQQDFADPAMDDYYVENHLAFSYDRYGYIDFVDRDGQPVWDMWGDLENYEATGHTMDVTWWDDRAEPADAATIEVEGPDGWTIYTGNGTADSSPVTVPAGFAQTPYEAFKFRPALAGEYRLRLTVGEASAEFLMVADDDTFPSSWHSVDPPDEQCVDPGPGGAGPDGDPPQLLVNGEASNDIVVAEGDPVTFSWVNNRPELDATVSLARVWGESAWQALGATTDVPVPQPPGTADVTLTFDEPGCNLVQMNYSWDGERYAYVQVEAADPGPTPTPPPTPDTTHAGGLFVPMEPCRLMDTRSAPHLNVGPRNTPIGQSETHLQRVHGDNGNCQVPEEAVAVAMNVTAVNPTRDSFLSVFPSDAQLPNVSNLNWVAGQAPTPNKVDVGLSADGAVGLRNHVGSVDIIADISGYYTNAPVATLEARVAELEGQLG